MRVLCGTLIHLEIGVCKNGLNFFSLPIVVGSPCPGYTLTSAGNTISFRWILFNKVFKFPPGKSVLPMLS